jgi:hypothetical protein
VARTRRAALRDTLGDARLDPGFEAGDGVFADAEFHQVEGHGRSVSAMRARREARPVEKTHARGPFSRFFTGKVLG